MPPNLGYDPIGTVQQAITSLLSTQEPQFIGIGNRHVPVLRDDPARLARHPDDAGLARVRRAHVQLRQAAARHLVRLRDDRLLRVADSGHRHLVLQPDHGPGGLPGAASSAPSRSRTRSRA